MEPSSFPKIRGEIKSSYEVKGNKNIDGYNYINGVLKADEFTF